MDYKKVVKSCRPSLEIMVVGEDKVADRIVVIKWQDAAFSLLASSPHSDNIRMRRRGGDALDS